MCKHFGCVCVLSTSYRIRVAGKERYFDLIPYCGLAVVDKHGHELKDPPLKDPFWKAVDLWQMQGEHVDADGLCVWDADLELVYITRHLGGRHYEIIGQETVGERRARLDAPRLSANATRGGGA